MTTRGQRTRATYEDYLNTPDDTRHELLDGELVMVPSPGTTHQRIVMRIAMALQPYVKRMALSEIFVAPFDVVLWDGDEANVVEPDLLFVSTERAGIITEANVQGAPDLAVEIRSPSTADRDLMVKRRLYAEHGVREYWLVDPDAMTVTVLLLGERGYEEAGAYQAGETFASQTVEGLNVSLDEIFQP